METEFAGQPVDGGTYPAIIFSRTIDAWEGIQNARQAGREVENPPTTESTDSSTSVPESTVPTPDTGAGGGGAPETGAGDTGGGGAAGGAPAAPTGGGVAPG
jgi:penicillin-binding protein 1A